MMSSTPVVTRNLEVLGSNPDRVGYVSSDCAYTVLQTVQRSGVCSAVYGTVYYKENSTYCRVIAMIVHKAT